MVGVAAAVLLLHVLLTPYSMYFSLLTTLISGPLRDKFSVIFKARHDRLLRIYDVLSIKYFKPDLCKQKDLLIDLHLPV